MKKNPVKLLFLSALLVGGASTLSACGDQFDGLTINFWHTFGHTVADGLQVHADNFAKAILENEGVKLRINLTYKGGYDDVKGEVMKNFAVGGNPTITVAYPDHVADYFASESRDGEYVVNLAPFANDAEIGFGKEAFLGDEYGADDFVEAFYKESTNYQKEGIYSVPFLKSTEVMMYNFELVKKAMPYHDASITQDDDIRNYVNNLTWDEFMDFCEDVKGRMSTISPTLEYPAYYDSDANLLITQLYQNKIPYAGFTADGKSYIGFNGNATNPTAEQTEAYADVQALLKKYKKWYDDGLFMTKGVNGEYSSNYFVPQKCMFAIGSSGGSGYSMPSSNEFTVECAKVPYSNRNPLYVTQGPTLAVLNNSKLVASGENDQAVKYAWKFIKYITNGKVNAQMCTSNSEGYIPVRESAYTTKEFTSFMASQTAYVKVAKVVVNDVSGRYLSTPVFKGSAELRNQCEGCFADVMKLGKNPSEAQIKTILDRAISETVKKM